MSKLTLNELSNSLNDYIDEKQNVEDYSLMTENKTIVGAINEIYGKEIIANAIGEPLNSSETFTEMGNDINSLLSTFKTNMMNSGVTVESGDKFKQLIDKIKGLTEGEGNKGIQFAEGTLGNLSVLSGGYQTNTNVTMNLDFIPNYIFINMNYTINNISGNPSITNMIICNMLNQTVLLSFGGSETYSFSTSITDLSSTGFTINISGSNYGKLYVSLGEYYAIGVGEEDTTIESSIISILKTKGYDESKDNIIDFIENKLYTKVIEPGTNVTIATGEGLESRRSENNQLFTKSLIVPSLSNLGSDNIKGLSLKVVSWAYHDDYGPQQYSMSDGYFRIQIKRDGVVINNAFESSAYTYNYNNGNGTTHAYDLLDVQEGDVIEYTVGYYASGFLGRNVHEYHFGVKGAYLTYSIGYVSSL